MGFGCKKQTPLLQQLKQQAAQQAEEERHKPQDPLPSLTDLVNQIHQESRQHPIQAQNPELQNVEDALKNLYAAKSYRAHNVTKTSQGDITTSIEFNRTDQSLHETIQAPNGMISEALYVNHTVYLRASSSTWENQSLQANSDAAQSIIQAYQSLATDPTPAIINAATKFIDASTDSSGCHLVRLFAYGSEKLQIDACLKNGWLTFITIHASDGDRTTTYQDFNQSILLYAPKN